MSVAAEALKSFVERIERLDEEKRGIAADIAEVKIEAAGSGFDIKVINQILKERRMTRQQLREFQELREIYLAALGMLDGTPLGDFARRRLMGEPEEAPAKPAAEQEPEQTDIEDAIDPEAKPKPSSAPNAPPPPPSAEDLAAVRSEGREAAEAGKRIIDNPYGHDDSRRAAWDEGHCAATGTDGMEIPAAWRRRKPAKPEEAKP